MKKSLSLSVKVIAITAALIASQSAFSELADLSEDELSKVDGAGIGWVLEDYHFSHGNDAGNGSIFKIGGIKSTQGENVEIVVNQLYIAGSGSNYGTTLQPVNLGRLTNPYSINVIDGNTLGFQGANANKAVLEIAAPKKMGGYDCLTGATGGSCSSRPNIERPDIGLSMGVKVGSKASHAINIHAKSAVVDGSYVRLWGDTARKQLVGEFKLNFYTPELSINACSSATGTCGSTIYMRNFQLEMALGNKYQPMSIDVNSSGNFVFELQSISKSSGVNFEDYYTNSAYRSNLRIGELTVGSQNFGSARLEGMLIQHLKITGHDLAP